MTAERLEEIIEEIVATFVGYGEGRWDIRGLRREKLETAKGIQELRALAEELRQKEAENAVSSREPVTE